MKIDLCKLFGVEEGEEFKIEDYNNVFIINWQRLFYKNSSGKFQKVNLTVNEVAGKEITKLPKKKQFTDDELCILRNIDNKYKWIARDKVYGEYRGYDECGLIIYEDKPYKDNISDIWYEDDCDSESLNVYKNLFQSIQYEDEEPVFIDDYVER